MHRVVTRALAPLFSTTVPKTLPASEPPRPHYGEHEPHTENARDQESDDAEHRNPAYKRLHARLYDERGSDYERRDDHA